MHQLLAHYFRAYSPATQDGLEQPQREAIIDLLNFCRIADEKLLPAEEALSAGEVGRFNWDSSVPLVAYAADSLDRVTPIVRSAIQRELFLADMAHRLQTTEAKTSAVVFCQSMFLADGDFSVPERAVFREIKSAFGWPA